MLLTNPTLHRKTSHCQHHLRLTVIEIIRFPPSHSKPLVFRQPERCQVALLGPGLSSTCHTLHLSEGLSASSHAQVCTRHPSGCDRPPFISSSHFFSPGPNGPGEKKWLEEAIGRILCPKGRRPFIWAARYRAARAAYPETSPTAVECGDRHPQSPYSALLRMGFTVPSPSPERRCALTAPFHPYPRPVRGWSTLCCTFPRVAAAGCYPACLLSRSPDLPPGLSPQRTPASSSRAKDTILHRYTFERYNVERSNV